MVGCSTESFWVEFEFWILTGWQLNCWGCGGELSKLENIKMEIFLSSPFGICMEIIVCVLPNCPHFRRVYKVHAAMSESECDSEPEAVQSLKKVNWMKVPKKGGALWMEHTLERELNQSNYSIRAIDWSCWGHFAALRQGARVVDAVNLALVRARKSQSKWFSQIAK